MNNRKQVNNDLQNANNEDVKKDDTSSNAGDKSSLTRQKTSQYWNYFTLTSNKKGDQFTNCKINGCKEVLAYHGGTSSMQYHLKALHNEEYLKCKGQKEESTQSTLTSPNFKFQPLSKEKTRQITMAVSRFIAFDMRPINVIEGQGFIELIHTLEPRYEFPCRTTFTQVTIPELYEASKKCVITSLNESQSFAITFDYWQSFPLKSYLTVTIHFCTPEFEPRNFVLQTIEVTESHTGPRTASVIQSILHDFDLLQKPHVKFIAISDAAKNMISTAKELNFPHIICLAHVLNNSLRHSFKAPEIKKILDKVKALVSYFRSCPENNYKLIQMQQKLSVPVVKLKKDKDTRWNTVYISLESVLNSQQAIVNLAFTDKEVLGVALTSDEWESIAQIKDILSPFFDITNILCTSRSPSISMIKPLIRIISQQILKVTREDSDYCETIKRLIYEDFVERVKQYDQVNDLLLLSTILDPRFKNLEFLDSSERNRAQSLLKAKFNEYKSIDCNSIIPEENSSDGPDGLQPKKTIVLNNQSLKNIFKFTSSSIRTIDEYKEINLYLQNEEIPIEDNPLRWWKDNAPLYKILSLIARDTLLIPATSVPSERVFSKAGEIVFAKRSSLCSKNIDVLIFLAENRKELC